MAKASKPRASRRPPTRRAASRPRYIPPESVIRGMIANYEQMVIADRKRLVDDEAWLAYWKSQLPIVT